MATSVSMQKGRSKHQYSRNSNLGCAPSIAEVDNDMKEIFDSRRNVTNENKTTYKNRSAKEDEKNKIVNKNNNNNNNIIYYEKEELLEAQKSVLKKESFRIKIDSKTMKPCEIIEIVDKLGFDTKELVKLFNDLPIFLRNQINKYVNIIKNSNSVVHSKSYLLHTMSITPMTFNMKTGEIRLSIRLNLDYYKTFGISRPGSELLSKREMNANNKHNNSNNKQTQYQKYKFIKSICNEIGQNILYCDPKLMKIGNIKPGSVMLCLVVGYFTIVGIGCIATAIVKCYKSKKNNINGQTEHEKDENSEKTKASKAAMMKNKFVLKNGDLSRQSMTNTTTMYPDENSVTKMASNNNNNHNNNKHNNHNNNINNNNEYRCDESETQSLNSLSFQEASFTDTKTSNNNCDIHGSMPNINNNNNNNKILQLNTDDFVCVNINWNKTIGKEINNNAIIKSKMSIDKVWKYGWVVGSIKETNGQEYWIIRYYIYDNWQNNNKNKDIFVPKTNVHDIGLIHSNKNSYLTDSELSGTLSVNLRGENGHQYIEHVAIGDH